WRASLVTSGLFGLWHIAPSLHTMSDNHVLRAGVGSVAGQTLLVLGAVPGASRAGLAFCSLRPRPPSPIAPTPPHPPPHAPAATNCLALTVAWFAVHHASLLTGW